MENVINFYNKERLNFHSKKKMNSLLTVDDVISHDAKSISWSRSLKNYLKNDREISFNEKQNRVSLYRPFTKTNLYFDKSLNEYVYQLPLIFPVTTLKNKVITITGLGTPKEFSVIMTDVVPDVQLQANGQCFPLYLYEKEETQAVNSDDLFTNQSEKSTACEGYQRHEAITDEALTHFKAAYPNEDFDKEDMFYYIYGLLHSEEYREKYADNLSKQLPRIPCVKSAVDFWAFSKAGRELAELHLNYETVPMYQNVLFKGGLKLLGDQINGGVGEDFYVEKMKFGKKVDEESGKKVDDKTTVIYNNQFTLCNIPEEAYDYIVNGKPALEWVMERQSVKTDKASGIVNDANDWAIETMNNPRYPMELFLRVVTVSLETMRIVKALPKLDI